MADSEAQGTEAGSGTTPAELVALKDEYEGNIVPLAELHRKYEISGWRLRRYVARYRWRQRRPQRIDRNDLLERLFRLIDVQIQQLEKSMKNAGPDPAAALTRLVNSLDKLIAMKDAETKKHSTPKRASKAMVELRTKIAARIAELNQP